MSSLIIVSVLLSFLSRVVEGIYEMVEGFIQLYEAFYMFFLFFFKKTTKMHYFKQKSLWKIIYEFNT